MVQTMGFADPENMQPVGDVCGRVTGQRVDEFFQCPAQECWPPINGQLRANLGQFPHAESGLLAVTSGVGFEFRLQLVQMGCKLVPRADLPVKFQQMLLLVFARVQSCVPAMFRDNRAGVRVHHLQVRLDLMRGIEIIHRGEDHPNLFVGHVGVYL